jgi:hypothetical protein
MADIDTPKIVPHIDNQPIFVSANIKNSLRSSQKIDRWEIGPYLMPVFVSPPPDDGEPRSERGRRIRMLCRKLPEHLARDDVHDVTNMVTSGSRVKYWWNP